MITKAKKTIYFLLPGLLRLSQQYAPSSALQRLLARARLYPRQDLFQNLEKLPSAALSAYYHGLILRSETRWCCHVDWIQYQLDHRMAYGIGLNKAENINQLEQLFKPEGLTLQTSASGKGFCFSHSVPEITFSHLSEIIGQPLFASLPQGPAQSYWRRLLTECQMLLQQEEKSIWFWGEGVLPETVNMPFVKIYGAHDAIHGLAKCAGIASSPLPACFNVGLIEKGMVLLADEWFLDKDSNREENWFKPLYHALKQRKIDQLILDPGKGHLFQITPWRLYYFWKKNENSACPYD